MKENIMFLEEWIDYHLNLGYDIGYHTILKRIQSLYKIIIVCITQFHCI